MTAVNKLYYFTGNDEDAGVFVGAKTWRDARNMVIGHEALNDCEFVDIRGSLCMENGKPVYTEVSGEHEAEDLLAAGYTSFWWSDDCAKCGVYSEHLNPVNGELICSECEEKSAIDKNACPWCGATVIHTGGCVQCPDPAFGWCACG